jgi:uncharacterized protein DUF5632/uncharacterized protein DUF5631
MAAASGDPWFQLMVGHWWTPGVDLGVLTIAATKRQATSSSWQSFSDQLRQQLTGSLSPDLQKGITADDLRDTFQWGAKQAGDVAETNGVIGKSHSAAHRYVSDLNSRLETIADDGKAKIDQIQQSKDLLPVKLGKIVDVVMQCQQDANSAAAPTTQNVFEAMQNILDQRGVPMSARQFAQQHGIDTTRMLGSPSKETVTQQVRGLLGEGGGPPQSPGPAQQDPHIQAAGNRIGGAENVRPDVTARSSEIPPPPPMVGGGGPTTTQPAASQPNLGSTPSRFGSALDGPSRSPGLSENAGLPGVPGAGPPTGLPATSSPVPMSGLSNGLPTNAFSPSAMGSVPQANGLMQGLNPGLGQGTPMPSALNNMPPMTSPVQPQLPTQAMSNLPASTMPSAAQAPAFDAPPSPPAPPVSSTSSPVMDSGATYLAGPAAQSAAPPAGPLPSYGSDIRPPTPIASSPTMPSSPVTTPSGPSTYSPASAPVGSSAGTSGLSQPAVIRQPASATVGHPAPASIGEQAVAVTAGGAAAGAASEQATAKARLQRLVDFVARQEPRLRWVAGDRADGTTLLMTDLASGWIPPGIKIPSVVTLLEPGDRRGDIEALLGQVEASASYTPLHYLPESDAEAEPTPTSLRPRRVPAVDDLGWELSQATNYRDGLPQMAHTIAQAAFADTGLIEVEIQLLDEHLTKLREDVIGSYPEDVEPAAVSNWQLLAAIDALAAKDPTGANYHFAWFQALNRVP